MCYRGPDRHCLGHFCKYIWTFFKIKIIAPAVPRDKNEPPCFRFNKPYETGHTNLKTSLSNFRILSTAECECGDCLQAEQFIFWNFKLYEDQRVTMMDILSENSKKEYPKSVTELVRLEEKRECKASVTS
jgi:hypothetical protein